MDRLHIDPFLCTWVPEHLRCKIFPHLPKLFSCNTNIRAFYNKTLSQFSIMNLNHILKLRSAGNGSLRHQNLHLTALIYSVYQVETGIGAIITINKTLRLLGRLAKPSIVDCERLQELNTHSAKRRPTGPTGRGRVGKVATLRKMIYL